MTKPLEVGGGEDEDIYMRLAEAGLEEREYPLVFIAALAHEDDERTKFHPVKAKSLQQDINKAYLVLKKDLTRIDGEEPALPARKSLMQSVRKAFTEWSDGAAEPEITIDFQGNHTLHHFTRHRLEKRLVLEVRKVNGDSVNSVAIVTTCKGRLAHLRQSLPLMLEQGADEVIVVDYGCPEGTADWVKKNYPQVKIVRVDDDPGFCLSCARNAGARAVKSDWICFIDADILVQPGFVAWMRNQLEPNSFYRTPMIDGKWDACGSFIVSRVAFERIGGYDEVFRGWGGRIPISTGAWRALVKSRSFTPISLSVYCFTMMMSELASIRSKTNCINLTFTILTLP